MSQKNFSLVIPCYNESKNISFLLKKYSFFLKKVTNEIILVNNGSIDDTYKVFKKVKNKNINFVTLKKNTGFGNGLIRGINNAKGKYIIYSHADLELDPNDVKKSIILFNKKKFINKNDKILVKGLRINKRKNNWSFLDIIFSNGLTVFSSLLFFKKLVDIHGIPVIFPKVMLKKIKYLPKDFSIDLAIYLFAKKNNFKIFRQKVNFNKKNRKFGDGNSLGLKKKIRGSIEQFIQAFLIFIK